LTQTQVYFTATLTFLFHMFRASFFLVRGKSISLDVCWGYCLFHPIFFTLINSCPLSVIVGKLDEAKMFSSPLLEITH